MFLGLGLVLISSQDCVIEMGPCGGFGEVEPDGGWSIGRPDGGWSIGRTVCCGLVR